MSVENFNGAVVAGIANELDFSGNQQTMDDFNALANKSSLLDSELTALSNAGYEASFNTSTNVTSGTGINLNDFGTYSDSDPVIFAGSLRSPNGSDGIYESGAMVGQLAAAYAIKTDAAMLPLEQNQFTNYSYTRALGTELLDLGKQDVNTFLVKQQVEAGEGSNGPFVYFEDGSGPAGSSAHLAQAVAYQSNAATFEQNATTYFSTLSLNTAAGQADLASLQKLAAEGIGPANPLNIDFSHLTSFSTVSDTTGQSLIDTVAVTQNANIYRVYNTAYGSATDETTTVTDQNNTVLATMSLDTSGGIDNITLTESNSTIVQPFDSYLTVVGQSDNITFTASGAVEGTGNMITEDYASPGSATLAVEGNYNTLVTNDPLYSGTTATLSGINNTIVDNSAGGLSITGVATDSTVYGGSGALAFNAGGGTIVLGSGNASITGSEVTQEVFGGTGSIGYAGGTGYGDVIGDGSHNDYIEASQGGGWFEGGSGGMNFIQGSNSGAGTVLQGGGNGDTLQGGTKGGDYFLAGAGNENLIAGNTSGEQVMYLGTGLDTVTLGAAMSEIVAGTGALTLQGSGFASVFESASGGADLFKATSGDIAVSGFRSGTDHISLMGQNGSAYYSGDNTVAQVGGATYTLGGHQNIGSLFTA